MQIPRSCVLALRLLVLLAAVATAPVAAESPAPGYHLIKRIPMSDGWWDFASFDSVHRRVFVSRGNGVFRLDVDTGYVDQRIIPGSEGRASLVLPGGDQVLSTMAGYSVAILFEPGRGEIQKVFDLVQQSNAAVWDPASKLAWLMGGHGEAALIDPVARVAAGRVNLGDDTLEFAAADGHGHIYVHGVNTAEVIVVDSLQRRVTGHYRLPGCTIPTGLAYVASQQLLISACWNGVAKVLRADTGEEVASLPIGAEPDAVILDPLRGMAFIPSASDGTLSVLSVADSARVTVLERVATQVGTRTGALDPQTGLLYLPGAKFGPKNKLGWPEALPGTVELLVMAPAVRDKS